LLNSGLLPERVVRQISVGLPLIDDESPEVKRDAYLDQMVLGLKRENVDLARVFGADGSPNLSEMRLSLAALRHRLEIIGTDEALTYCQELDRSMALFVNNLGSDSSNFTRWLGRNELLERMLVEDEVPRSNLKLWDVAAAVYPHLVSRKQGVNKEGQITIYKSLPEEVTDMLPSELVVDALHELQTRTAAHNLIHEGKVLSKRGRQRIAEEASDLFSLGEAEKSFLLTPESGVFTKAVEQVITRLERAGFSQPLQQLNGISDEGPIGKELLTTFLEARALQFLSQLRQEDAYLIRNTHSLVDLVRVADFLNWRQGLDNSRKDFSQISESVQARPLYTVAELTKELKDYSIGLPPDVVESYTSWLYQAGVELSKGTRQILDPSVDFPLMLSIIGPSGSGKTRIAHIGLENLKNLLSMAQGGPWKLPRIYSANAALFVPPGIKGTAPPEWLAARLIRDTALDLGVDDLDKMVSLINGKQVVFALIWDELINLLVTSGRKMNDQRADETRESLAKGVEMTMLNLLTPDADTTVIVTSPYGHRQEVNIRPNIVVIGTGSMSDIREEMKIEERVVGRNGYRQSDVERLKKALRDDTLARMEIIALPEADLPRLEQAWGNWQAVALETDILEESRRLGFYYDGVEVTPGAEDVIRESFGGQLETKQFRALNYVAQKLKRFASRKLAQMAETSPVISTVQTEGGDVTLTERGMNFVIDEEFAREALV